MCTDVLLTFNFEVTINLLIYDNIHDHNYIQICAYTFFLKYITIQMDTYRTIYIH